MKGAFSKTMEEWLQIVARGCIVHAYFCTMTRVLFAEFSEGKFHRSYSLDVLISDDKSAGGL